MEEDEIIKIALAVTVSLLYYLFKSRPMEKEKGVPEQFKSPIGQVPRKEAVIEKTVSFEDILKKLQQNEPSLNLPSSQEVITARPAQLKKMLQEKTIRLEDSKEDNTAQINSYKNKPLIKDKSQEIEDAKDLQEKKDKSQTKEISNQKDEIHELKRELQRYKAYETKKEVRNTALTKMLNEPENVHNAFILSEIFNRKTL